MRLSGASPISLLDITEYQVKKLNKAGIHTISELISSYENATFCQIKGIGPKKSEEIARQLNSMGFIVCQKVFCQKFSSKISYMLEDIGGIFEVKKYTKNYLQYVYKITDYDMNKFENAMHELNIWFLNGDIKDEGLSDTRTIKLLYNYGICTVDQMREKYKEIIKLKGVGKKIKYEIDYFLSM